MRKDCPSDVVTAPRHSAADDSTPFDAAVRRQSEGRITRDGRRTQSVHPRRGALALAEYPALTWSARRSCVDPPSSGARGVAPRVSRPLDRTGGGGSGAYTARVPGPAAKSPVYGTGVIVLCAVAGNRRRRAPQVGVLIVGRARPQGSRCARLERLVPGRGQPSFGHLVVTGGGTRAPVRSGLGGRKWPNRRQWPKVFRCKQLDSRWNFTNRTPTASQNPLVSSRRACRAIGSAAYGCFGSSTARRYGEVMYVEQSIPGALSPRAPRGP